MASKKRATAELTADDSGFQRGMKRAEKRLSTFQKLTRDAAKGLGSIGGKVLGGAFGAASLAGTALLASEATKVIDFERDLTRLGITARGALGPLDGFRQKIFQVSDSTGVAREDVLKAATSFVALTGDGKAASASLELFAKVAKGTGASMEDTAASAAAMVQNLKIDPADLEKAFSIMIAGGKAGSVELRDMAGLLASLAPLAATFAGGSGTEGLADLSAGLQLARQGFGSASEAATGLEALMGSIVRGAAKFKKGGVDVFTKDKNGQKSLKGFQEIVEAIGNSQLVKDPTKLQKAFGSKEAYQAFLQLTKVKGAWTELSDETLKAKDVQEDFDAYSNSSAGRLEASLNALKNAVAETFTPDVIGGFVLALKDAVGFAQDLLIGLNGIGQWLKQFGGGKESDVSKMEGDDALQNALAQGYTLDQIEELGKMKPGPGRIGPHRKLSKAAGLEGEARDLNPIFAAAARRRAAEKETAKKDAAVKERVYGKRIAAEVERGDRPFDMEADAGGRPQPVPIHIFMDPSTTDLQGKIADHRGQTRR